MPGPSAHAYSWRDDAACLGVGEKHGPIFWSSDPEDRALALSYCGICPVQVECEKARLSVFDDIEFCYGGEYK